MKGNGGREPLLDTVFLEKCSVSSLLSLSQVSPFSNWGWKGKDRRKQCV